MPLPVGWLTLPHAADVLLSGGGIALVGWIVRVIRRPKVPAHPTSAAKINVVAPTASISAPITNTVAPVITVHVNGTVPAQPATKGDESVGPAAVTTTTPGEKGYYERIMPLLTSLENALRNLRAVSVAPGVPPPTSMPQQEEVDREWNAYITGVNTWDPFLDDAVRAALSTVIVKWTAERHARFGMYHDPMNDARAANECAIDTVDAIQAARRAINARVKALDGTVVASSRLPALADELTRAEILACKRILRYLDPLDEAATRLRNALSVNEGGDSQQDSEFVAATASEHTLIQEIEKAIRTCHSDFDPALWPVLQDVTKKVHLEWVDRVKSADQGVRDRATQALRHGPAVSGAIQVAKAALGARLQRLSGD